MTCLRRTADRMLQVHSHKPCILKFLERLYRSRPVARFQYLVGRNTFLRGQDFWFYYMFKTNFFWAQQNLGGNCSRMPPRGDGPVPQCVFHTTMLFCSQHEHSVMKTDPVLLTRAAPRTSALLPCDVPDCPLPCLHCSSQGAFRANSQIERRGFTSSVSWKIKQYSCPRKIANNFEEKANLGRNYFTCHNYEVRA